MKVNYRQKLDNNFYIFWSKILTDRNFLIAFLRFYHKWKFLCDETEFKFYYECKSLKEINSRNKKSDRKRVEFANALGSTRKDELATDLVELVQAGNLGMEWIQAIGDFVFAGWFCPPLHNLNIGYDVERRRVVIEINPETEKQDLEEAWDDINLEVKKHYPNLKREKFSYKKLDNLGIRQQDLLRPGSDKEKIVALFSFAKANVDKKRVANLRQIRRRYKQK